MEETTHKGYKEGRQRRDRALEAMNFYDLSCVLYVNTRNIKGNIVTDLSRNRNNGTIYGATAIKTKTKIIKHKNENIRTNKVFVFDGVNDYIDCGNNASLDFPTNDFTLELWTKSDYTEKTGGLITKGDINIKGYTLQQTGSAPFNWYFGVYDGTTFRQVNLPLYQTWDWSHIVCIKTNNHIEVWINGTKTGKFNGVIGDISNPTKNLIIGRRGTYPSFNGTIDEFRIYNKALTPTEILQKYNYMKDFYR
ncbi:TPA_asm: structural protein [Altiarchaeum virus]|nr:TPA_asm: structural protein [Altiarchaeum virus]